MKKNNIIISSAAIMGISGIIGAYILTNNKSELEIREKVSDTPESVEIYRPVVTAEPEVTPENTVEPIYYMLVAEGNNLNLYEVDGETKKKVKSAAITPEIFPAEDIELLKNGIHALSLEEGIEIMENFIS